MKSLDTAIETIHLLDDLAGEDTPLTRLSPLAKVGSLFLFLVTLVSLGPGNLIGALGLMLVLPVLYQVGRLPWKQPLRQLRPVLFMVGGFGMVNLFWFQGSPAYLGPVQVPGGIGVLLLLLLKAVGCVLAAYGLLATTSLEKLACALQKLPLPRVLIISMLLTWRYLVLLLQEGRRMAAAYQLRAPESRGIPWKISGSLLGLLFLRSLDRAQTVYESMKLRGFAGRFPDQESSGSGKGNLLLLGGTLAWCLICRFCLQLFLLHCILLLPFLL